MKNTKILNNDYKFYHENVDCLNPVIYPIVTSTTYKIKDLDKINQEKYTYSRSDNPTRQLLQDNLAILENGKYAYCFSSGLGALTTVCHLNIASLGIIASHDLYGGTKRYFNNIFQQHVEYLDFNSLDDKQINDVFNKTNEKLVWIETPSNPLLEIIDIQKISDLCHKYNKILCVDNTFLSPIFQNPLDLGADIVTHSITKYINGTSDVVMGCLICNDDKISSDIKYLQNAMGIIPSPHDCYLVNRNIKTLEIRMSKHQENAFKIAELLNENPLIERVIYPGLDQYNYKLKKQMKGFGGMISFYIKGGLRESKKFLNSLKIIPTAESLGGVETLIEHPGIMTHASIPISERKKIGITDNLIRLSVGLENHLDIYSDITQALKKSQEITSKL